MKIDPAIFEAPKAIGNCPDCGSKHYAVKNLMSDEGLTCEAITCVDCGFDILGAYWTMRSKQDRH